jgi:hypothetical protein
MTTPRWSRRLTETVTPKDDGKPMHTLADVVAYMDASIPRERVENERSRWHQVGKALLEAATENGSTDAVLAGLGGLRLCTTFFVFAC